VITRIVERIAGWRESRQQTRDALVLGAIADVPECGGYIIWATLRSRGRGMNMAMVYVSLERLERAGLIESWWQEQDGPHPRRRLYKVKES
jgi:DNA-binding PadR family transcriptional regulator